MTNIRDIFTPYDGPLPDPERVAIDLDRLADGIVQRHVARLQDAGYQVGQLTWRDRAREAPKNVVTDRANAIDPDSVGFQATQIRHGEELGGEIVIYWGGWADVAAWDLSAGAIHHGLGVFVNDRGAAEVVDAFTERLLNMAVPS